MGENTAAPAAAPAAGPGYTADEAIGILSINPIIFRWVVHTENVPLPRVGKRAVYDDAAIATIRAILDRKDPTRRWRGGRPERKNGPRGKRLRKPSPAAQEN